MDTQKTDIVRRFDTIAPHRQSWREKNQYYYDDQQAYMRFLIPPDHSVLEIGCATGDLLAHLKPARGVGIDISPDMIRIAQGRFPALDFRVGDIETITSWGETFDYIILADVVGHLFDIQTAFQKAPSVLPSGYPYYCLVLQFSLGARAQIGREIRT